MMRAILLAGSITALAACAPAVAPMPDENAGGPWRCDAEASQSLIGSHVGAVSFLAGSNVRMACTTCAVTFDYQEDRLNLFFDEETGIIERVTCG
ncbi:MAG: hypothetical protein ACK4Y4_11040 [Brevundimonas sp.]